jgi:hypothetical protein
MRPLLVLPVVLALVVPPTLDVVPPSIPQELRLESTPVDCGKQVVLRRMDAARIRLRASAGGDGTHAGTECLVAGLGASSVPPSRGRAALALEDVAAGVSPVSTGIAGRAPPVPHR